MSYTGMPEQQRVLMTMLGAMALCEMLFGLFVYLYPETVGLDGATAEILAAALLMAGLSTFVFLHFLPRLSKTSRGSDTLATGLSGAHAEAVPRKVSERRWSRHIPRIPKRRS